MHPWTCDMWLAGRHDYVVGMVRCRFHHASLLDDIVDHWCANDKPASSPAACGGQHRTRKLVRAAMQQGNVVGC